MPSYRELIAWQRAVDLTVRVYQITERWPKHETYGLSSQSQRAASSIPANIAEGQGLRTPAQFIHHLAIAHGSLCELETHLIIAQRLGYLDESTLNAVLQQSGEVARLVFGLKRSLG